MDVEKSVDFGSVVALLFNQAFLGGPVDEGGNGLDLKSGVFAIRMIWVSSVAASRYGAFNQYSGFLLVQGTIDEGIRCTTRFAKVRNCNLKRRLIFMSISYLSGSLGTTSHTSPH